MHWPSPWSEGFPGWHLECSAMGTKYLGEQFDIHGGGMDLLFPHHECEIAQSVAALGKETVHYWMHNNMITINGTKMGKSLGNFITLDEFFTGNHSLLTQPFSAMTIRFFILQAHYRSTIDFSSEALVASEKGLQRLMEAYKTLINLTPDNLSIPNTNDQLISEIIEDGKKAIDDDLNSPILISKLFNAVNLINSAKAKTESLNVNQIKTLKDFFDLYVFKILGLKEESSESTANNEAYMQVVDLLLNMRIEAKANKDWATSDKIRNQLTALGFVIKDTKEGFEWKLEK